MPDRIHADVLAAALRYARRGWKVFPTRAGGKNPHKSAQHSNGRNWGMTSDEDEIRRDYATWPEAGVALPTGRDNMFFVVDVDSPEGHDHDGIANFEAAQREHGVVPETQMARTPSGGVHYFFKYPAEGEVRCITDGSWIRGVDVKGRGGYVLAAPTVKTVDGVEVGRYDWINRVEMAEAPQWILDAVIARPRERPLSSEMRSSRTTVSIEEIRRIMDVIPNGERGHEDREWGNWNKIAMTLYRVTGGSEDGFEIFKKWCDKSRKSGQRESHDETWRRIGGSPPSFLTVGTLIREANIADPSWRRDRAITVDDYQAFLPNSTFIFEPTNRTWNTKGVNSQIGMVTVMDVAGNPVRDATTGEIKRLKAAEWLSRFKPIHEITWAPGEIKVIEDKVVSNEGWKEKPGTKTYNHYQAPNIILGSSRQAGMWLGHVDALLGEHRDHVLSWLAFKVQHPGRKINHALVFGGPPGIGKDTLLEPLREAVGGMNFKEATPSTIMDKFNPCLQSVILRINEARDLGDINRYQFYERMKNYIAAPPEVIEINKKHEQQYCIPNVVGIIYTTNHKHNGLYLPPDDRRHYVVWSDVNKDDFHDGYFTDLYEWYENDGYCHVAAYLHNFDLVRFNPAAPPRKTEAFLSMVEGGLTSDDDELADLLDEFTGQKDINNKPIRPDVITPAMIKDYMIDHGRISTYPGLDEWLKSSANKRQFPHKMEMAGYVLVRARTSDGKWTIQGRRTPVYARAEMAPKDQMDAATRLTQRPADSTRTFGS